MKRKITGLENPERQTAAKTMKMAATQEANREKIQSNPLLSDHGPTSKREAG